MSDVGDLLEALAPFAQVYDLAPNAYREMRKENPRYKMWYAFTLEDMARAKEVYARVSGEQEIFESERGAE